MPGQGLLLQTAYCSSQKEIYDLLRPLGKIIVVISAVKDACVGGWKSEVI